MSDRVVVRVDAHIERDVRAYAKAKDVTVGEATDRILKMGLSRVAALSRYGEKTKGGAPPAGRRKRAKPAAEE